MSPVPSWLDPAVAALTRAPGRGALIVSDGPLTDADAEVLAESAGLPLVIVDARLAGLLPDGVMRAALPDELGGLDGLPDPEFCADAVGEGEGARQTLEALSAAWRGDAPDDLDVELDDLGAFDDPDEVAPDEAPRSGSLAVDPVRRAAVLGRLLAAAGDLSPRLVLLRDPGRADASSLAALRLVLAGGNGAGTAWIIEGPLAEGPVSRLLAPIRRAGADERFEGPVIAEVSPPAGEDASPNPAGRGTATELLAMLQSGGLPYPEEALVGPTLHAYRGQAPRATLQDLEGLLHAGRARVEGGWVVTDDHGAPGPGPLRRGDARALLDALDDAPTERGAGGALRAALATAAGLGSASEFAAAAATELLERGDALGALRCLEGVPLSDPELALLAARARLEVGDPATAQRLVRDAILADRASVGTRDALHLLGGRLAALAGDDAAATKHLEASELPEAALLLGQLHEQAGRYHEGAAAAAEAARAFEGNGDPLGAARAFAQRARCIAGAGKAPRALQELKHAMKRTPDPDDPRAGALDVRIAMGFIFREAGDREKARQALGLAARRAHLHALADREAGARLSLARYFLEALPVRGAERGEALSAGREAAEGAIQLARGIGRADLEAQAESLLGELAWRSEDWTGAADALEREQELWTQAGNLVEVVDVALRRGQLASRREDWQGAFEAANAAQTQAQRRRLTSKLAQAQMLRAEALEHLDRRSEALSALQEAQRIYGSLGEAFAAQAGAAERRAQQLISG